MISQLELIISGISLLLPLIALTQLLLFKKHKRDRYIVDNGKFPQDSIVHCSLPASDDSVYMTTIPIFRQLPLPELALKIQSAYEITMNKNIYTLEGDDYYYFNLVSGNTRIVIGRGKTQDIVINDPVVSRMHLLIYCNRDKWYIENKGKNATLLNGDMINRDIDLEIHLGDCLVLSEKTRIYIVKQPKAIHEQEVKTS